MNTLQNPNPSHSYFLQSFLKRNVRDIQKTLKQHTDLLEVSLELQTALKKERKPKDATNEMDIVVFQKSVSQLKFVLDWLDTQITELEK